MFRQPSRRVPQLGSVAGPVPRISGTHLILVVLATAFLALHLAFQPSAPAGIDGVNFLLGLQDFNVADHRPHPPGYPVFMALGKFSNSLFERTLADDPVQVGARALAIWGILLGALAAIPLFVFFRGLELNDRWATAATALTMTCPLFWFTASRPMSDIPGLVVGLTVQALIVTGFRRYRRERDATEGSGAQTSSIPSRTLSADRPLLLAAAFMAGIAIGFRSQNAWLTIPLLIWVAAQAPLRRRQQAHLILAFSVGLVAWLVPLITVTGGPRDYVTALSAQGFHDLTGADIFATNPTLDRLVQGLIYTFAYPWADSKLAALTVAIGILGAGMMLARSPAGVLLLATAAVPYALFHLLFQESLHTRYALPLVPAMAYLAARGLDTLTTRGMPWLVTGLSLTGMAITFPSAAAYARTGSPVYQAIDDVRSAASHQKLQPVLEMHHAVARMLRGQEMPLRALPSPAPKHEWLELVKHWRQEPDTPVWFLAEAGRADLALVDPRSRRLLRSYAWSFPRKFVMGRVPSLGLEWYEMNPPGWIAAEGWSLSHEAAGIAVTDGWTAGNRPIRAFVRSRNEASVLMVSGRNFSSPAGPTARFTLSLRGKLLDSWDIGPVDGFFLRTWRLPAGFLAAPERYLPLEIRAAPIGGKPGHALAVAVEQFDLQSQNSIVYGFDSGWYAPEFDGATPRPWRWTGPVANLRIHSPGGDLVLQLTAEVPIKYLDGTPQVSIRAGKRVLTRVRVDSADLNLTVRIPGSALAESAGVITLETDRTFIPDHVMGNGDLRRLGLRAFRVEIAEAKIPNDETRRD